MAFSIPSREQLFRDFVDAYALAFPEKNVARGSDPYRLGRVVSAVAWSILAKGYWLIRQILPDTADDEQLQRWGTIYAFPKNGPAPSQGVAALQVSGVPGSLVTQFAELAHQDGTRYEVTTANAAIGGGGTVIVDIAAISTGAATNKAAGETLTFVAPPNGVQPAAVLVAALANGEDNESVEAYRQRLLSHLAAPPVGGAVHDYIAWALQVPGVATAYVYRHRRKLGTIDVAVLGAGRGTARLIANLAPVTAWIDARRPASVKDWVVLTVTALPIDVTIDLVIDELLYQWDWDDAGVGYTITAADANAKTITVPTAPAAVVAGKRLTVKGEEATVSARNGNVLTLTFLAPATWFTFNPVNATIRASGDLVLPVREAVSAVFDRLGPARGAYAATAWDSDLVRAKLIAAAADVPGVKDLVLVAPAANQVIADTLTQTVSVFVPGDVAVRRKV